ARLMRSLPRWWGQAVASRGRAFPQRDAVSMALLSDIMAVPAVRSPSTVEMIRVSDRGPPDMRSPYHHEPFLTARATSVDTFDLRPAVGDGRGWYRAKARS